MTPETTRRFVRLRRGNVSWGLLASRRAPLVVGCLRPLFEENQNELRWEDAVEKLAEIFAEHANHEEFAIAPGEQAATARSELRDWLKRGLVVEREGRLIATDALQKAFDFIAGLEVARKEARGDLLFGMPLADWFRIALPQNRVKVIEISPEVSIDSTRLPEWDHKDPGDRLVVATARVHRLTVLTSDRKILSYPHVASLAYRKRASLSSPASRQPLKSHHESAF